MRTLIILGHPDKNSFCTKLADSYERGAVEKGGEIKRINLIDLNFDPILRSFNRPQPLEADLEKAQKLIKWANHLVFVFPIWWSAPPALLKGFIDRVFLPGFAFQLRANSSMWDKLLLGRSARLIMTSDASPILLHLAYFHPTINMMKKATLEYCGIRPVSVNNFGSMRTADDNKRDLFLEKVFREGLQDN